MNVRALLLGYQIDRPIDEGVNTLIYRGIREEEPTRAIVKTLKAEYPTLEEMTRLRHEYKILQNLSIEAIAKPIALETYHNGLALILEDFAGESLHKFIQSQKLTLVEFLEIAIQLADILAQLHQNQIIHKDIKPQNILINPQSGQIRLIDFSISTRLSRENPTLSHSNCLEGTLAYMSPEQTGRMNRSIDYRTDFYSLGITFYEMLSGKVPFQSTEPMELIHCHIAKTPDPLWKGEEKSGEIPKAIADIVMKLLAKTAEDRYQSARGLKADLEVCLSQLQKNEKIDNFIPGKLDRSGQFLIPQKLYGREIEVAKLLDAFDRVASPKENRVDTVLTCQEAEDK